MKELEYPFDAAFINKKSRSLKKSLLSDGSVRIKKRIALLGGFTTSYIKQSLELFLLNYGIEPQFYESDFGLFYEDAIFPNAKLEAFKPDLIYVCTCNRNIQAKLNFTYSKEQIDALINDECERFRRIWDALKTRFNVPILQNNFEKPLLRILGNNDACDSHGKTYFINTLNVRLAENIYSREDVYLVDLDYIASDYGLRAFSDPFYWYLCKSAVSLDATPYFAFNVANVIKALYGKNKKCLVLDLDNTLWGGVISEDGLAHIKIGQETSEDQAYLAFQQYLQDLSRTGVVLTVASKNDEAQAKEGLSHPEEILKADDFALIRANWEPKSANIKAIAKELNLLEESFVFIDDNPAERLEVQSVVPQVVAPDISDLTHRCELLDRCGYFENVNLSKDDLQRNAMYHENMQRKEASSSFKDYGEYLDSLQMSADIKPFDPIYFQRIAQLCNKSNQFNLTTLRLDQQEIASIASDPKYVTFYVSLKDRFGDNGVVSLFIGQIKAYELHIRLWLMSCRVLKRDLEHALADTIVQKAQELKLKAVIGYYIPSKKNAMVQDFYQSLGYEKIAESKNESIWRLPLEDDRGHKIEYSRLNTHITVNT